MDDAGSGDGEPCDSGQFQKFPTVFLHPIKVNNSSLNVGPGHECINSLMDMESITLYIMQKGDVGDGCHWR